MSADVQSGPPLDTAELQDAYGLLADAVVATDRDGTIRLWNRAATALFGWSAKEATGQTLDLIIPDKHRATHWQGYHRVMATGRTTYADRLLEVPALHAEGHRISIAFTVSLISEGDEPAGVVAVVRDETARRAELRDLRARLDALGERRDEPPAKVCEP